MFEIHRTWSKFKSKLVVTCIIIKDIEYTFARSIWRSRMSYLHPVRGGSMETLASSDWFQWKKSSVTQKFDWKRWNIVLTLHRASIAFVRAMRILNEQKANNSNRCTETKNFQLHANHNLKNRMIWRDKPLISKTWQCTVTFNDTLSCRGNREIKQQSKHMQRRIARTVQEKLEMINMLSILLIWVEDLQTLEIDLAFWQYDLDK